MTGFNSRRNRYCSSVVSNGDTMTDKNYYSQRTLSDEEYDIWLMSTPLEARFDIDTLETLVCEGIAKHAAHDMTLEEYIKSRTKFIRYDDTEKKRLSFYLPLFPAMRSADFADQFNISLTKFLVSSIELGLIRFMFEYHEQYDGAVSIKRAIGRKITDTPSKIMYMQISKQKISLNSATGVKSGEATHFTPNVYEWFYDALAATSIALNISMTDLCYCCWCITMQNAMSNDMIDSMLGQDISDVLHYFDVEIDIYGRRIENLLSYINEER